MSRYFGSPDSNRGSVVFVDKFQHQLPLSCRSCKQAVPALYSFPAQALQIHTDQHTWAYFAGSIYITTRTPFGSTRCRFRPSYLSFRWISWLVIYKDAIGFYSMKDIGSKDRRYTYSDPILRKISMVEQANGWHWFLAGFCCCRSTIAERATALQL